MQDDLTSLARVSLRMPKDLRLWLEREADHDHRNLNGQIVHFLEQVRACQAKPSPPSA